jgi:serine protease Do
VALFVLALPAAPVLAEPERAEITYWESVRESKTPAELEAYLKAYPDGSFAPLARIRLKALQGTASDAAKPAPPSSQETSSQELSKLPDLIDRVAPSVVSIRLKPSAIRRLKTAPKKQAPAKETGKDGQSKETKKPQPTTGSGMILSPDGFIVTASSVVDKAGPITVVLADGTRLPAKIVGLDKRSDVALLKVDAKKPLPAVSLGDSDRVRRGQRIIAIGTPFGLGGTVSLGIISATGRDIGSGPYDYLQTDAAINRGHSGGPLFDFDGEVVGMSSAIFSPTGGNVGIAFAVPSNLVRDVAQKLKQSGYVERGWLGVKIQNVTEDIAQSLGLEKANGAMISVIKKDGPAAGSGLAPGDVVVSVDGRTVADIRHFARIVGEFAPDTDIELVVSRKGKSNKVRVKLGKFPGAAPTQPSGLGDVKDLDLEKLD